LQELSKYFSSPILAEGGTFDETVNLQEQSAGGPENEPDPMVKLGWYAAILTPRLAQKYPAQPLAFLIYGYGQAGW